MTKEKLYDELANVETEYGLSPIDVRNILEDFFSQNVVIPKGKNRHKYADIIHAYAEGLAGIEVLRSEGWTEFKQSGMCLCIGDEYRIKPSEPVYEWQWKYRNEATGLWTYSPYMTDTEFDCFCYSSNNVATKDEETKRERK